MADTGFREIRAEELPLMPPGEFIGIAVENRGLSVEDFAKQTGIELTRAQNVLSGKEEPDAEFLEKGKVVFPKATRAFQLYAELYHATQG